MSMFQVMFQDNSENLFNIFMKYEEDGCFSVKHYFQILQSFNQIGVQ